MSDTVQRWLLRLGMLPLGAVLALAFPAPSWWWLGWVGLVPILVIIARSTTRREALIRSWLGGAGFLVALHYWLMPHMGVFTIPAAAFAGLFWLPLGLAVWAFLGEGRRAGSRPLWALLVIPSVWLSIEAARSWEYLGGTWGLWGLTQWQVGPLVQTAALGGVWLLSFLLVLTNTGLAVAALPDGSRSHRRLALGVAVAVPLLMLGYGLARGEPPVTGRVAVAGVQPGVIESDWERLEAHVEMTESLERGTYDFVVWGQSSVASDPDARPEVAETLREVARAAGTDVFVNIDAEVVGDRIAKVVVQYTPQGPVARYAKQRLVPFGEFIPLRPLFGWVAGFTEAAPQDRVRGDELTTMSVAGIEIGPLVSYESTFPAMRRQLALRGADLTVVQGGTWTFQGTWAQPQQASYEAVRAVASGRPAILVAVSGTSAAFDARGRLLTWVPADREVAYVVDIPISTEDTVYVRLGDWVVWLAAAVTVAAAGIGVAGWLQRRTSRELVELGS